MNERDIDVLVVGDANPDLLLRGDVVPRFGQAEQLLDAADLVLGGSGAIVAHGLARLGMATAMAAVVGDDTFGGMVRDRLVAAGVDVSPFRVDPALPTGLSVILGAGGERAILTLVGSIGALAPDDVPDGLLARTRHVHASSFYLQPKLRAGLAGLFARARAAGATTSLDTNYDPAETWGGLDDVLPLTDVLLPNRTEVLGIAGLPDAVDAARALAARGPLVVVKDGADGAFAVGAADAGPLRVPATPVTAVDTTGAGDSFDAAFLAGYVRGLRPETCLALACRAGALSTRAAGGTAAQATAADLADLADLTDLTDLTG